MRIPLVAGNWKMHGSRARAEGLLAAIVAGLPLPGVELAVMPPFPYLAELVARFGDRIAFGAQDVSAHREEGAHTGEVAAAMLADVGCRYVIVGHSERRRDHGEHDALVWAKAAAAVAAGLVPIVCLGETWEEREAGLTEKVLGRQLQGLLADPALWGRVALAYEPVWAIGTGRSARPEQVAEAHAFLRRACAAVDATMSRSLRILYGGSVKADNAAALLAAGDVDGALVGGAALEAGSFLAIARAAAGAEA